jgi:hypothetical protein
MPRSSVGCPKPSRSLSLSAATLLPALTAEQKIKDIFIGTNTGWKKRNDFHSLLNKIPLSKGKGHPRTAHEDL